MLTKTPKVRIPLPPPLNLPDLTLLAPCKIDVYAPMPGSACPVNYAHALLGRCAITHHSSSRVSAFRRQALALLRVGWPVLALLGILWFPFDWLSEVWPAFGAPFRMVFRDAHDHFVGHTIFFLIVGLLLLAYIPVLRRPYWYFPALVVAALAQETIQALARGATPTFTDTNAFAGDAIGGLLAFALWVAIATFIALARLRFAGRNARP